MDTAREDRQDAVPSMTSVVAIDEQHALDELITWFNKFHEENGLLSDDYSIF